VELTLRRAAPDGVQAVEFTPAQFLGRLAALFPPPRMHLRRGERAEGGGGAEACFFRGAPSGI